MLIQYFLRKGKKKTSIIIYLPKLTGFLQTVDMDLIEKNEIFLFELIYNTTSRNNMSFNSPKKKKIYVSIYLPNWFSISILFDTFILFTVK